MGAPPFLPLWGEEEVTVPLPLICLIGKVFPFHRKTNWKSPAKTQTFGKCSIRQPSNLILKNMLFLL